METSTYSSASISNALAARFKEAFGVAPAAPFDVSNVQNHNAQMTYTVTAKYDFRVISAPVSSPLGDLYTPEGAITQAHNRGQHLLSDAGNTFREQVLNALKAKPQRFKRGEKFTLCTDPNYFSSIEPCHPCAGQGAVTCYKCSGTSTHSCDSCNGRCTENCTGCWGSGWATPNCNQCHGTGSYAGQRCPTCHGSGQPTIRCYRCAGNKFVSCTTCNGQGRQQCGNCRRGQVTCNTCHGAQTLTYAHHVGIDVSTSVNYAWQGAPRWMSAVIENAVNGGPADIFKVRQYESAATDPYKFVGLGHVEGGEATVRHNGVSANCQFIGDEHHTVFLDGILSGAFKSALDGVAKADDVNAVAKASQSQIAATLIKEVESGSATAKSSSPVKKGVISADQATTFLNGRAACKEFITRSSESFSMRRVLRFTGKVFVPLFVFYLLLNMLNSINPHGTATGRLGLGALFREFGDVVAIFILELRYSWVSLIDNHTPIPLIAYAVLGWVTARFFAPVLFPLAWRKFTKEDGRFFVLIPFGMLLASLLMALYPSVFYVFRFQDLLKVWTHGDIKGAITTTLGLIPQILGLSLLIAAVRYKAAGVHWTTRMLRKLQPR